MLCESEILTGQKIWIIFLLWKSFSAQLPRMIFLWSSRALMALRMYVSRFCSSFALHLTKSQQDKVCFLGFLFGSNMADHALVCDTHPTKVWCSHVSHRMEWQHHTSTEICIYFIIWNAEQFLFYFRYILFSKRTPTESNLQSWQRIAIDSIRRAAPNEWNDR